MLTMLRMLRIARLLRKLDSLSGANSLRILQMVLGFVLVGHWGGLAWYMSFILPFEQRTIDELILRAEAMGNVRTRGGSR